MWYITVIFGGVVFSAILTFLFPKNRNSIGKVKGDNIKINQNNGKSKPPGESDRERDLRILYNVDQIMGKEYAKTTINFMKVMNVLLGGTSTSGRTSCCEYCRKLGIDPYGYDYSTDKSRAMEETRKAGIEHQRDQVRRIMGNPDILNQTKKDLEDG